MSDTIDDISTNELCTNKNKNILSKTIFNKNKKNNNFNTTSQYSNKNSQSQSPHDYISLLTPIKPTQHDIFESKISTKTIKISQTQSHKIPNNLSKQDTVEQIMNDNGIPNNDL